MANKIVQGVSWTTTIGLAASPLIAAYLMYRNEGEFGNLSPYTMYTTHGAFLIFYWSTLDWIKEGTQPKLGIALGALLISIASGIDFYSTAKQHKELYITFYVAIAIMIVGFAMGALLAHKNEQSKQENLAKRSKKKDLEILALRKKKREIATIVMDKIIKNIFKHIIKYRTPKTAVVIFAALLISTGTLGIIQNTYSWVGEPPPRWIGSIDVWKLGMVIGTAGTAAAFLATLYFVQRNYLRGREHIPHLTMTLSVERVPVSMTRDAIFASMVAENTGTGLCEVRDVIWTVVAVSPYDDDDVNQMVNDFTDNSSTGFTMKEEEFPWHEVARRPVRVNLIIEPGEAEQLTQDFVIESGIGATITSAYVANASDPKISEGWYRRTLHKGA